MHLNLKKYKKIASDKDSSTFKHPDGHEMKVMHRSLSPAMRKEVSAIPLAEGGKVSAYVDTVTSGDPLVKAVKKAPPPSDTHEGADWSSKPVQSASPNKDEGKAADYKSQAAKFNAKMAPEQAMAEGGVASSQPEEDSPEKIAADAQAGTPAPVTINIGAQPAAQAPVPPSTNPNYTPEQMQAGKGLPPGTSIGDLWAAGNMAPGPAISPVAASLPGPEGATPTVPGSDAPAPQEPPVPEEQGHSLASVAQPAPKASPTANPFQSAYDMQLKGLQMGEKAQEMAAKGKEEALNAYNDQQKQSANTYDSNVKDAMALRQQALEALQNTKVDPDRYWNNKSTGGQISTILGIIAAGFNPTHNPNAAIDMLNKSIDRDIESQKMDIGKKQNLLSAANDHFRNIQSAAEFHRILANDLVSHQIDLAIAKAGTPMAKAELLRAQGELQKNQAVMMATIGARQTLNGHASPEEQAKALNTLEFTDKEAAKMYRAREVPGFGIAQRDIPDSAIQEITAKKQLHDAASDLIDYLKNKGSSLSLNDRNVAAEKAQVVQSLYREGLLKTVYKQGEQPLLDKVVSENPLSFVNTLLKTEPSKLREIIGSNQRSLNTLLKGYGVPTPSQIPQRPPVLNKR